MILNQIQSVEKQAADFSTACFFTIFLFEDFSQHIAIFLLILKRLVHGQYVLFLVQQNHMLLGTAPKVLQ